MSSIDIRAILEPESIEPTRTIDMNESTWADWRPADRAAFYHALLDSMKNPIAFCDTGDVIQYMNAAAADHYGERGGRTLLGRSVLECHNHESREMIAEIKARFLAEPDLVEVMITDDEKHRIWMRAVREEGELIGYYERYERPKDV